MCRRFDPAPHHRLSLAVSEAFFIMDYRVYILYSLTAEKSYVGYTNDIGRRIREHNQDLQRSFTSRFRPWAVIHTEEYATKHEAMIREKWYKTGVGREAKAVIITKYLGEKE